MNFLSIWQESLPQVALKGGLVLAAALLIGFALHRLSAARRYPLWLAAAVAAAVLPLVMPFVPAWRVLPPVKTERLVEWSWHAQEAIPNDAGIVPVPAAGGESRREVAMNPKASAASPEPAATMPPQSAAATPPHRPLSWRALFAVLPSIWAAVALLLLGRIGVSAWRLRLLEFKERGQPAPADLGQASPSPWDIAAELSLKRFPKVLIGRTDAVPMVWGILTPRLLLPAGFESWPPNKTRAVLLHELAHLKRRDPLALLAGQVMQALHWFNPLAWLTLHRLRADQERACDDTVLRHGVLPSDYAQSLFDLSRQTRLGPGLSLCALAMAREAPVEARITAVLDSGRPRQPATRRWSLMLMGVATIVAVPLAMLQAAIGGPKLRGRILDRHGVVLAETTDTKLRNYPLKALAAHVIGYTGQHVDGRPQEGRLRIEQQFNAALQSGSDLRLTLDVRVQKIAEDVLKEANSNGAIVVLDTQSSEVLAMASWPSYDLNPFVPRLAIETFEALSEDPNLPLFPRAHLAEYPGGDFFRVVTAIAGLAEGKTDVRFACTGSFKFASRTLTETPPHGDITLEEALVRNCRVGTVQLAAMVGYDRLLDTAHSLGFGDETGLGLGAEGKGMLPSSAGSAARMQNAKAIGADDKAIKETATQADQLLGNLATGSGTVLATPLQLAQAACVIANGGSAYRPRLLANAAPTKPLRLAQRAIEQIEIVRRAMRRIVAESVDMREADYPDVEISGIMSSRLWRPSKKQMLTSFVGFAPYQNPRLALAVVVEGPPGRNSVVGNPAAAVAGQIVEKILALPADGSGTVEPQEAREPLTDLDALRVQVEALVLDGVTLQSVRVHEGTIEVIGEARSMSHALMVRQHLITDPEFQDVEWGFGQPTAIGDDGKGLIPQPKGGHEGKVLFRAVGRELSKSAAAETPSLPNPDDERRWRLLQKAGGLADLPEGIDAVTSGMRGNMFPRDVTLSFTGPRGAVRTWILRSAGLKHQVPGAVAPPPLNGKAIAESAAKDPRLRKLLEDAEKTRQRVQHVTPFLTNFGRRVPIPASLPEWPETGHAGTYVGGGPETSCSVSVFAVSPHVVFVTLNGGRGPSSFLIAE